MAENFSGEIAKNGKANAGFVLGIIGLFAWILPIIGAPITIAGLVFSIKGLRSLKRGLAIAGIVLSSIGLFATTVNGSIGAYMGATGQHPLVNKIFNKGSQPSNNSGTSRVELINQAVKEVKAQLSLPYKFDQVTTITDITAEPDAIRYHYVLSGVDTGKITSEILKNGIAPGICKSEEIKDLLNQGIYMEYSYVVENSEQKYFVSFAKSDCK